ncbi:MAG: NADH-quinone oxidoreductase subunit N, partial [Gordonia sp.]|nr:NADH-quinone oxidoreductase subunit N [Gordonia sp. (in: high G+C Gram-positive bacteria)]
MTYDPPSIAYGALSPMLIVLGAAVVGVLLEAVLPRAVRFRAQLGLALVAIVAAFAALVVVASTKSESVTTVSGAVVLDGTAMFLQGTV